MMSKSRELLPNPVTVKDDLPAWVRPGDVIEKRGDRYFIVSLYESEPRWRHYLRRLKKWWRK
jgi:hypothetical protein